MENCYTIYLYTIWSNGQTETMRLRVKNVSEFQRRRNGLVGRHFLKRNLKKRAKRKRACSNQDSAVALAQCSKPATRLLLLRLRSAASPQQGSFYCACAVQQARNQAPVVALRSAATSRLLRLHSQAVVDYGAKIEIVIDQPDCCCSLLLLFYIHLLLLLRSQAVAACYSQVNKFVEQTLSGRPFGFGLWF